MGKGRLNDLGSAAINLGQLSSSEALIAGEQFITPIPCESDSDVFSGELCNEVCGDSRGVSERLVVVPDECGEQLDSIRPDDELMVIGAIDVSGHAGIL